MVFYKCEKCGNIVTFIERKCECVPKCCGETMVEINPNTTDAAREKHVPEVCVEGNTVKVQVGSVIHPMLDAHYIGFIGLETSEGYYQKNLKPNMEPVAVFNLNDGEKPVAVYENCNLHGMWKKEL
ncbi:MAG: desulfoferrodoxin Dfx [Lachnospiraceae bacterium]|nr:desulfoferrodoxin Dfx [Lachnospiraceae bacterium]